MVASCSRHYSHQGSSGALKRTKTFFFFFFVYLASVFTDFWSNKVPFNTLFYGYADSKQIIIFHNNLWWSVHAGIECAHLLLCVQMHTCYEQFIITSCLVTTRLQREPRTSSKSEQHTPVVCDDNTCFDRGPLLWWPNAAARLWVSWTEPLHWVDGGVVSLSMTRCWALWVFWFGFCAEMQAEWYVEGKCLFSLMDEATACQYAHLSL